MAEKLEAVTVHVPPDTAAWLRAEAERRMRSIAFIAREAIDRARARREAQQEAA